MKPTEVLRRIVHQVGQMVPEATHSRLRSQLRHALAPRRFDQAIHLLDGLMKDSKSKGADEQKGGVIINISIAVAVGAPNERDPNAPHPAVPDPTERAVVATAVTGNPDGTAGSLVLPPPDASAADARKTTGATPPPSRTRAKRVQPVNAKSPAARRTNTPRPKRAK